MSLFVDFLKENRIADAHSLIVSIDTDFDESAIVPSDLLSALTSICLTEDVFDNVPELQQTIPRVLLTNKDTRDGFVSWVVSKMMESNHGVASKYFRLLHPNVSQTHLQGDGCAMAVKPIPFHQYRFAVKALRRARYLEEAVGKMFTLQDVSSLTAAQAVWEVFHMNALEEEEDDDDEEEEEGRRREKFVTEVEDEENGEVRTLRMTHSGLEQQHWIHCAKFIRHHNYHEMCEEFGENVDDVTRHVMRLISNRLNGSVKNLLSLILPLASLRSTTTTTTTATTSSSLSLSLSLSSHTPERTVDMSISIIEYLLSTFKNAESKSNAARILCEAWKVSHDEALAKASLQMLERLDGSLSPQRSREKSTRKKWCFTWMEEEAARLEVIVIAHKYKFEMQSTASIQEWSWRHNLSMHIAIENENWHRAGRSLSDWKKAVSLLCRDLCQLHGINGKGPFSGANRSILYLIVCGMRFVDEGNRDMVNLFLDAVERVSENGDRDCSYLAINLLKYCYAKMTKEPHLKEGLMEISDILADILVKNSSKLKDSQELGKAFLLSKEGDHHDIFRRYNIVGFECGVESFSFASWMTKRPGFLLPKWDRKSMCDRHDDDDDDDDGGGGGDGGQVSDERFFYAKLSYFRRKAWELGSTIEETQANGLISEIMKHPEKFRSTVAIKHALSKLHGDDPTRVLQSMCEKADQMGPSTPPHVWKLLRSFSEVLSCDCDVTSLQDLLTIQKRIERKIRNVQRFYNKRPEMGEREQEVASVSSQKDVARPDVTEENDTGECKTDLIQRISEDVREKADHFLKEECQLTYVSVLVEDMMNVISMAGIDDAHFVTSLLLSIRKYDLLTIAKRCMEEKSLDFFKGRLLRFLQSTGRISLPKFSERKLFFTDLVRLLAPEVKNPSAAVLPSLLQKSNFNRSLCEDFCEAHGLDRGFALMVYIAAVLLVPIPAISREQLIQTGPKRKHFVDLLDFWTELPPLIHRCDPDRIASWLSEKCWRRLIPYDYERIGFVAKQILRLQPSNSIAGHLRALTRALHTYRRHAKPSDDEMRAALSTFNEKEIYLEDYERWCVISCTRLPISCFLVTPAPMELIVNEDRTKLSFTENFCASETDLFWLSVLEGELVPENESKFSYLSRLFKREHSDWFWTVASCHIMQHLPTGKARLEKLNSLLSMFKDEYNQAFACFKLCSISQSNYERRVLGHWAYRKAKKCPPEKMNDTVLNLLLGFGRQFASAHILEKHGFQVDEESLAQSIEASCMSMLRIHGSRLFWMNNQRLNKALDEIEALNQLPKDHLRTTFVRNAIASEILDAEEYTSGFHRHHLIPMDSEEAHELGRDGDVEFAIMYAIGAGDWESCTNFLRKYVQIAHRESLIIARAYRVLLSALCLFSPEDLDHDDDLVWNDYKRIMTLIFS